MAKDHLEHDLDRGLEDLSPDLRWREWMRRIEAVLIASASPDLTADQIVVSLARPNSHRGSDGAER